MQIWGGSSDKWAAFVCVFVSHRAAAACDLHEEPEAHTYARAKACEAMLLDGELARFRAHAPSGVDIDAYVRRALAKHRFRLPHRDRFPELLGKLGLNRTAVEIGVREGHWSRMFLGRWRGRAYHGVDPLLLSADLERYRTLMPEVHAYGVETIAALENDPRWHFHHGLDHKFVDAFSDGSLDFVYIDSAHNYRDVTDTFDRWWPKLRPGGIIAGHDYCVGRSKGREEGVGEWPRPDIAPELAAARVPTCGVYACIVGEFCYPKDKKRRGQEKIGFSGVALAAREAVARRGSRLQFTGEGGVVGNPSTAAGKPLCDSNGVRGFPTIKYGDPSDLQAYEGGRDEKALKKFAEEKLVPMCSVKNIDLCSADKKAELEKYMALDTEELTKLITAQEDELKQIEEEFKKSVEGLQKLYEGYTKDKEEKMAKLKDGGLGLMKSVKASRKGASKDEL
ncbi:unnamed protein product [Pelagomonas calceolata]|uniref:Thioredoxin domain-containing protein n=1 Tax=Pelagomonas calceolata TaxID=35677 RepID=A0A8J2SHJ8_9STRA|nr:unnamed protein product [Pelagomonas calceolata]